MARRTLHDTTLFSAGDAQVIPHRVERAWSQLAVGVEEGTNQCELRFFPISNNERNAHQMPKKDDGNKARANARHGAVTSLRSMSYALRWRGSLRNSLSEYPVSQKDLEVLHFVCMSEVALSRRISDAPYTIRVTSIGNVDHGTMWLAIGIAVVDILGGDQASVDDEPRSRGSGLFVVFGVLSQYYGVKHEVGELQIWVTIPNPPHPLRETLYEDCGDIFWLGNWMDGVQAAMLTTANYQNDLSEIAI
ncbi:hypothetical protein SCHPADRAFT_930272 [Schizopora paradoxa]|uniref:Uncharacterized protein n=1 Tax=Schizopora paradoxa TaxID=27342 RepID=A0A0H2RGD3_9AGAM|nr:hypothetical protein SCHPADRAFT_930272 [Schizopora paradoxa]